MEADVEAKSVEQGERDLLILLIFRLSRWQPDENYYRLSEMILSYSAFLQESEFNAQISFDHIVKTQQVFTFWCLQLQAVELYPTKMFLEKVLMTAFADLKETICNST